MSTVRQSRKSTAAVAPVVQLRYPLTTKTLREAFAALSPDGIQLSKQSKYQEATVDGTWSLTKLMLHLRNLGLKPTGPQNVLAFVNHDETIGCILYGVEPHPTRNTWKNYSIEVQARPLSEAQGLQAARAKAPANLMGL